jgi:hypothetical protein
LKGEDLSDFLSRTPGIQGRLLRRAGESCFFSSVAIATGSLQRRDAWLQHYIQASLAGYEGLKYSTIPAPSTASAKPT